MRSSSSTPSQSQGKSPATPSRQGSASALLPPYGLQSDRARLPSDYLTTCERTAATEGSSRGPDELYSMKSWPVTSNAAAKKTAKASSNKSSISSQRSNCTTRLETGVVPRKDTFRDARDRLAMADAAVPVMRSEQTLAPFNVAAVHTDFLSQHIDSVYRNPVRNN